METATAYPRAASRSWMEINVRPWLAITVLMAIVTIAITIYSYRVTALQRRLITQGIERQAIVSSLGADARQKPRDEEVRVTLRYEDPVTKKPIESEGMLHRERGAFVALKQPLTIRIDPANSRVWTARTVPEPMLQGMLIPVVLLPVVLLCLLIAWRQRQRVMRTLRDGAPAQATVVSIKQSALAPMSRHIGLVVEGFGPRVRSAYWPSRVGAIAKGDVIDVIASDAMVLPARPYR